MDQNLKNKIDAILNSGEKKSPDEIKAMLLEKQPFVSLDKIISLVRDKKIALQMYEEIKKILPEFYVIIYKSYPIKCGWSSELELDETRYYCKALDEYFILSKNKIHFTLINENPKFQETVKQHILSIEENCLRND